MNAPYDPEAQWRSYAESLTGIVRARDLERERQRRDAAGQRRDLDSAGTAAASAEYRRDQLRQSADELEQFADRTLGWAGVPAEGDRMVFEPPVINSTAEAEAAMGRLADELAETATAVVREREDREKKLNLGITIASWIVLPGILFLWTLLSTDSVISGIIGAAPILMSMAVARKAGLKFGQVITGLAVTAGILLALLIGGSFLSTLMIIFLIPVGIIALIKVPRDWALTRRRAGQEPPKSDGTQPWNESEV
ncbi:hypothetical protein [Microlunatus sp. GCM10028923]|uniref:hypothetical protein n=1 Tax=Microlunatus sp. GCM10028923 TaxID=3273400 RepID=UPI003620BA15